MIMMHLIRSMRNRINAYEDRHKRSEAELSESTRPDLSVPPAPDFLHMPDDETYDKPSTATSGSSAAAHPGPTTTALDGSTILRIPKVLYIYSRFGIWISPLLRDLIEYSLLIHSYTVLHIYIKHKS